MKPESLSLFYSEGTSNKEYHVHLLQKEDKWVVNFSYGRRGQALKADTKTKEPVEYAVAKKAYDKIVKEKTEKGYSTSETGGIFQQTASAERFSGIVPQLLNSITEEQLEVYIKDPNYVMQQKYNGERRLLQKNEESISGINKKGLVVLLPVSIEQSMQNQNSSTMVVDGEIIGETVYVFDILEKDGLAIKDKGFYERYKELKSSLKENDHLVIAPVAATESEKRQLLEMIKNSKEEGIVIKEKSSKYVAGRPASGGSQLKFKFVESATVMVDSVHQTKRSVGVIGFENDKKVELGNVTIYPNMEMPAVGDVIEVEYLYAYKNGSLYQSVYLGKRNDQDKSDCTIAQLKFKPEDEEPKKIKKAKL